MDIFGYVRVSTEKQSLFSQKEVLKSKYPGILIYEDVVSTRKFQTNLKELLSRIQSGDTLVVTELSRIGRSLIELFKISEVLKEKKVCFISLKEGIDTSSTMGTFLFNVFGSLYELERDIISERTKLGLATRRKYGIKGGKKPVDSFVIKKAIKDYYTEEHSIKQILSLYKISRTTFYKYLGLEKRKELDSYFVEKEKENLLEVPKS